MKKTNKLLLTSLINIIPLISLASCAPSGTQAGNSVRSFFDSIIQIFNKIIYSGNATQLETLIALSIGLILLLLFYSVLDTMTKGKKVLSWLLSISVTTIVLISTPKEILSDILIGYGAMGATMLLFASLVILIVFSVKTKSITLMRLFWLLFAFYFILLYFYKTPETNSLIYIIGTIIGILMFIFIPKIKNWILKEQTEILEDKINERTKRRVEQIHQENLRMKHGL